MKGVEMLKQLEKQAFNDLTMFFWNEKEGNFSFSAAEKISSPSITAVCTMAIKNYESGKPNWLKKNKSKIEHYLVNSYPWTDAGKHYQNTMAMAFGYLGLKAVDSKNDKLYKQALEFLESQQNDADGGWFFSKKLGESSHPYFTCWALRCFLEDGIDESRWENVITPAFYYLLGAYKEYHLYPTTYNLIRHSLSSIETKCKIFLTEEEVETLNNLYEYKVERFQGKDGTWKSEPAVINSVYFRKTLFSLKNLYLLSSRDYNIISDVYAKMFEWIKHNHMQPGWPSDTEPVPTGLSWTTGYILLGLTEYRKALKKYA